MIFIADVVDVIPPFVIAAVDGAGIGVFVDAEPAFFPRNGVKFAVLKAKHSAVGGRQIFYGLEGINYRFGLFAGHFQFAVRANYSGARHVRGVDDKSQVVFATNIDDFVITPDVAADADKHNGAGAFRNASADGGGAQAHCVVDIGEDHLQTGFMNGVIRRHESNGCGNDFVAVVPAVLFLQDVDCQIQAAVAEFT